MKNILISLLVVSLTIALSACDDVTVTNVDDGPGFGNNSSPTPPPPKLRVTVEWVGASEFTVKPGLVNPCSEVLGDTGFLVPDDVITCQGFFGSVMSETNRNMTLSVMDQAKDDDNYYGELPMSMLDFNNDDIIDDGLFYGAHQMEWETDAPNGLYSCYLETMGGVDASANYRVTIENDQNVKLSYDGSMSSSDITKRIASFTSASNGDVLTDDPTEFIDVVRGVGLNRTQPQTVRVNLQWNSLDEDADLNLNVADPCGATTGADGGGLGTPNWNTSCQGSSGGFDEDGGDYESISWRTDGVPNGNFQVFVHYKTVSATEDVNYNISVRSQCLDKQVIVNHTGVITPAQAGSLVNIINFQSDSTTDWCGNNNGG